MSVIYNYIHFPLMSRYSINEQYDTIFALIRRNYDNKLLALNHEKQFGWPQVLWGNCVSPGLSLIDQIASLLTHTSECNRDK
jgi:hypothetical protein